MREPLLWWIVPGLLLASAGCATRHIPSPVTADGIRSRTGFALPVETGPQGQTNLPPGIGLDRPLSSDDASAVALWNNAQFQADLATIGIARGDLIDAGLLRNPRLDILFPVGAKPFELVANFPIEVFWQRPRRVAASEKAYEQLGQSLIQNGLNVVRDARLSHADFLLAQSRQQVAAKSADLRKRIAELTNARLRAGDISELEAMAARTDEGTAREQLVRFEHDTRLAEERFRIAVGLALDRTPIQVAAPTPELTAPPPVEELLGKAMEARPDLRATEIAIAAATKRAGWERSRLALVTAQLSSKGVGANGILTGPGLSAEVPIFHLNQGLIARADAEVEVASRQYLALKQRVAFEVHEARELLIQAQTALTRLQKDVLAPLQQTSNLAEDQYKKGDVAYLFVLEQSRGFVDAMLRVADAEAAVRRAQAQLERSVGAR